MPIVDVKDKVVIVTGAGRGLGRAYAEALAGDGAKVVIAEINPELGEAVARGIKERGGEAIFVRTDVADYDQCEQMVETAVQTYGRVDALINNAAVYYGTTMRPFFAIVDEEWERHMAVDVKGAFNCCKAMVPRMVKQGKGHIINVGSTVAMEGVPMLLDYLTAKGAIIAMTKGLAREVPFLGDAEITVNCVCPGFTYTEASENLMKSWAEKLQAAYEASRAVRRKEMPSDLIGIIAFLVSDASDYITGGTFPVDGGRYLP